MMTRYTIVLLLVTLIATSHIHARPSEKLKIGITNSLNKVFQTKPFNFLGKLTKQAEIELSRNEYESTQIVLFPELDFNQVKISISPLTHENKVDVIDSVFVELNPVGYVNLQVGSKSQARRGYHPDVLLPNQSLDLRADIPQSVLLTIYAPATSRPGRYIADISITNEAGLNIALNLSVLVHSVQIPKQRLFKSLSITRNHNYSSLWPESQGFKKLDRQQESEIFRNIAELGFRNHLPPTGFWVNGLISSNRNGKSETYVSYPTHNRQTGEFDVETTDEHINYMLSKGANSFFIGVTSDIYKHENTSEKREQTLLKYLDDLIPHLKKRGVLDQSYLYNIDEPWGEAVDHAKKIYRLVKQRYGRDVHVIQNTNQNNNRILGEFKNYFQAIDINLGFYKVTELQRYRDDYPGIFQDVWWNLNLWPRTRPNLFLEYPLIDARIIGPMSYRFNIQGFEYWELVYIKKIKNYRPVKADDFQLDWEVNHHSLDGLLLYPNEQYNFYSSMRFESFRDGMEDLELLYLLQQLDPENKLLAVSIVNDIDDYVESGEQYMVFRKALLAEIQRLEKHNTTLSKPN